MPSTSSAPDADYAAPVLATTPTQEAQLKRKRNPASWQKNVSQTKRNSGEEYISKRKKVIAARKVGAPCTCPKQKGRSTVYDPSSFDLTTVDLPLKYPEGVRLKKEKLADLKYLLSYIPLGHKSWYEELFQAQGVADAPAAEDDDPDDPDHIEDDVLDYH